MLLFLFKSMSSNLWSSARQHLSLSNTVYKIKLNKNKITNLMLRKTVVFSTLNRCLFGTIRNNSLLRNSKLIVKYIFVQTVWILITLRIIIRSLLPSVLTYSRFKNELKTSLLERIFSLFNFFKDTVFN
jgi:hypothetical protein